MKKINIFLFIIIVLALFLRFYRLSQIPPSLTWDEVAWGYNAYSLGLDGKDEFGKFLPIAYLESFGDFKPSLYAYLSILPVKIFGLTEFSTRFASAFFGVLTVLISYFLTKEIFYKSENKQKIALIATGILAISPWHILLSRAAFEANIASFFVVLGVYLFLRATNTKSWLLMFSIVSFVLSMYVFNTARVVVPLLVLGLVIGKIKILWGMKKQLFLSLITGIILFFPLGLFLTTPQAQLRFNEVNIFSDAGVIERANKEIENDNNAMWSKVIHNRRLVYSVEYLKHYFDNFNPSFLFFKGDGNPKFSIQDVGQMYIWEIPFFITGILFLFKKREGNWWVVPFWMIVGIIPAATARETPHALRIEVVLPTFQIFTAYGLYCLMFGKINKSLNIKLRNLLFTFLGLVIIFNFIYFYHNYFIHYPREFSGEWQYGYKDSIGYIKENQDKYDKIIFTEDLGRPYIYFLFYTKYDPNKFRKEADIQREVYGFVHVNSFDKYIFTKDVKKDVTSGKVLRIDKPENVPSNATVLKKFYLLNGNVVLVAYEQ